MIEGLVVLLVVGLLSALAWFAPHVPVEPVLWAGALCTAVGLLVGVPTGVWYHVRLRAVLLAAGALPERWWLHPVAHHGSIPPEARRSVLAWFYAGGVGFVVTVLGCAIIALAVLIAVFGRAAGG